MSTTSQTEIAKFDKQKFVASLWITGMLAFATSACSVHQNGAADQKVAPTLGVSDKDASRGPASVVSPPHYSNPDVQATGQAGAPGAGFDKKAGAVRDSSDPTEGMKAESRKR